MSRPDLRIGHGYDLHRLEALPPHGQGNPLIVGGVHIPHDRGPVAHSDGDALYHALTDAILGALARPDIGQLFPDTDPRHESQNSFEFLSEAARVCVSRRLRHPECGRHSHSRAAQTLAPQRSDPQQHRNVSRH